MRRSHGPTPSRPPSDRPHPKPSSATFNRIALAMAAAGSLDLALKAAVAANLMPGDRRILIDRVLALAFVENRRSAMGVFAASPVALVATSLAVVAIVAILLRDRLRASPTTQVAFGAVLGGALGNVVDRVRHGYVLDYVAIPHVSVFNFADACISCGVATIAFVAVRERA